MLFITTFFVFVFFFPFERKFNVIGIGVKDIFKKYKILSYFFKCHKICNYFFVFMEMHYFTLLCSFIDMYPDNHLTRAHENWLYNKMKYINSTENSKKKKSTV